MSHCGIPFWMLLLQIQTRRGLDLTREKGLMKKMKSQESGEQE